MVSLQGFDATTVSPEGMEPLPVGDYTMAITASEQNPRINGADQSVAAS